MTVVLVANIAFQVWRGDLVPANDGFGWDGATYAGVAQDVGRLTSIVGERARRVLPSVVAHGLLVLVHAKPSTANVIDAFLFLNSIGLLLSLLGFLRITAHEHFRRRTQWIGFFALFWIFPTAKFAFHYPPLTDVPAFTMATWATLFALKRNPAGLAVILILSSLTWSSFLAWIAVLLVFKPEPILTRPKDRWLGLLVATAVSIGYGLALHHSYYTLGYRGYPRGTPVYERFIVVSGLVAATYLFGSYYYLCRRVGIVALRGLFRSISWTGVGLLILGVVASRYLVALITNDASSPLAEAFGPNNSPFIRSATLPGVFIVMHCVYFGPMFVLVALFWPHVCEAARERGFGILAFLALTVFLSLSSESRHLTHTFPMVAILVLIAIERLSLETTLLPFVALGSLVASKAWYRINVGPMHGSYLDFPWQRYFMNQGPWVSVEMYLLQGGVALAVTAVAVLLLRNARRVSSSSA